VPTIPESDSILLLSVCNGDRNFIIMAQDVVTPEVSSVLNASRDGRYVEHGAGGIAAGRC
jgi:hypothetical protein